MANSPAIGIDLGTTNTCAAVVRNGVVEIIVNEAGKRVTPSYVTFLENERLFGDISKSRSAILLKNTVFDAKRLLGRKFDDNVVQDDKKRWPFKIRNANGKPIIRVELKGKISEFYPEQISAFILGKIKTAAEAFLGEEIVNAVITVPAYFNDSQKQATKDAGIIAGFNVMKLLVEPTAAAITYGFINSNTYKTVLIYDLGGGTFDVSIVVVDAGINEVKSIDGDNHLGGEDFNNNLVDYLVEIFESRFNANLKNNLKAMHRVEALCEKAKCELSFSGSYFTTLESLADDHDFEIEISRSRFESLNMELFEKTINIVDNCLKNANMDKNDIEEVILVGGSTRIPKIRDLLKKYFNREKLGESLNPEEAVAFGAAILADTLRDEAKYDITDIIVIDVVPLPLGIESAGGKMNVLIDKNSTFPTKCSKFYTTNTDDQEKVYVKVFEGENEFTRDNNLLGQFALTGIPLSPRGVPRIEVIFCIDMNGILSVEANEISAGLKNKISIEEHKGRLTSEEIDKMKHSLNGYDRKSEEKAKKKLLDFCSLTIAKISDLKISKQHSQFLMNKCNETLKWLDSQVGTSENDFSKRYTDLQRQYETISKQSL